MPRLERCPHCGATSHVATCSTCGGDFVITEATLDGRVRRYDDAAATDVPTRESWLCDFDLAKQTGPSGPAVSAGLRQKTCPSCHTQFI